VTDCIVNLLPVDEEEKREFEAIAPDAVHIYAGRRTVTQEQLEEATVILGWPRPGDMAKARNLKWFQTMWAGTEEYEGMLPPGAVFTCSAGSNSRSVAEHMLTSLLAVCRKLPAYLDSQRARRWQDEGAMKTILGGTVLVLGAGHVGADFAKLCQALGARTVGCKRTVDGPILGFDELYTMDMLDSLLPQADVVAMALPHTAATVGLMDERRLRLMKEDAVFLNAGRGSAVDQEALVKVMREGRLWGAALDVTVPEPLPGDSPLWDVPNLLITPHVAGGMRLEITRKACIRMAQDNLRRYLAGEELANRVR